MSEHAFRVLGVRSLPLALLAALLAVPAWPDRAEAGIDPLDRVQLHRNSNRSVPYLPLAQAGASAGATTLVMRTLQTIELDGDPLENAYSSVRPIDVDGDGQFELVQYNGFRSMQVWSRTGAKLWRVENPDGRTHDYDDAIQRDPIVVTDLDGDGKQDIAHCWANGTQRVLVYRRGLDGAVIRSTPIQGIASAECQIAAVRVATQPDPLILVAFPIWDATISCPRNFIGNWVKTVAFDTGQQRLWDRATCDAGHYVWPLDEDQDGFAEAFFVGKYLLRPDGSLQCMLNTWPASDHVDGMAIADLDPARPGLEAVAVGGTGTAMFSAATCQQVWRIPNTVVRDPQHVVIAQLDPASPAPSIVIDERGSVSSPKNYVISAQGVVQATGANLFSMQNANLDGALGMDEAVGAFGIVLDRYLNQRLTKYWYWSLKGSKVVETSAGSYPNSYDRWQAFPLVVDWDGDGRDELVTWGQSLIVIGKIKQTTSATSKSTQP